MMLPNGWKKVKLGDVIKSLDAGVSVNSVDEPASKNSIGVLKTSCVSSGSFNPKENKAVVSADIDRVSVSVKADRIILSRMNSPSLVGANAYIASDFSNLYLPDRLWQLEPYPNKVNMRWLSYVLGRQETKNRFLNMATGTSNSMKNITKEDVLNLNISLPPIEEQKKIAATLSVWDSAIEKMEKLIEAKSHNFKLLMEKLVVKQSLKKQTKTYSIKELFDVVNRKNKVGNTNVLTSSAQYGLVNQQEYYKKSIASSDISGYYLLEKGDFAYNRSYSTGYPYGVIKRLDKYESGVLSTLYLCMTLKKDYRSLSDYFVFLFESGYLNNQLALICREGARNHGLLNVSKDDFFNMKVQLPSEKEQQNIVCILQNHSCELSLLKQQLENYKKQKQGLMQNLLTGQWRVK